MPYSHIYIQCLHCYPTIQHASGHVDNIVLSVVLCTLVCMPVYCFQLFR